MNGFEQPGQADFGFQRPSNHRLRRGIYLVPSMLTAANLLCGYYAVVASLQGGVADFDNAARAIGIAVLFDSLDGFVARATHTNSEFGKQFDSLADVISFGVAPAILAYAWGVRSLFTSNQIGPVQHVVELGWLVMLAFVICCAWRLARFNIHGMAPGGSRYFIGMPTPAAAGMIAATVHAFKTPIQDWRWSFAWLVLVAYLAGLMTSTVRHYSFKDIPWAKRQHSVVIVLLLLLGGAIIKYSEEVLLLIAGTYAASGIALHVVRVVRHRMVSRPA